MTNQIRYIAKVDFTYDGVFYARGDEWEPGGFRLDDKLIELEFVREVAKPIDVEGFYCQECKRKFKSKSGLMSHRRAKHDA